MDCSIWPTTDLGEVYRDWQARAEGGRYPWHGTFELTERCNLACVHCFINQPPGSVPARSHELTARQIGTILDQITEAGCLYLLLTGGEPLLRPDFEEIYLEAKRHGLLLTLFTNGTLLTPRVADLLGEWRPWWVEITLYGATERTYEAVTQVPGSYARCLRGIELLRERGVRLGIKSVVMDVNRGEFVEMQALARSLELPFHYNGVLWPRFDGGQAPVAHRLSAAEIVALEMGDPEKRDAWKEFGPTRGGQDGRGDLVYGCGAGRTAFHIDSAGRLSICMMARRMAYDLIKGSFREGWRDFLGAQVADRRRLDSPCRTCRAGDFCPQCPGWSQAVHGDDETPVEFVCELGRLRLGQFDAARA